MEVAGRIRGRGRGRGREARVGARVWIFIKAQGREGMIAGGAQAGRPHPGCQANHCHRWSGNSRKFSESVPSEKKSRKVLHSHFPFPLVDDHRRFDRHSPRTVTHTAVDTSKTAICLMNTNGDAFCVEVNLQSCEQPSSHCFVGGGWLIDPLY